MLPEKYQILLLLLSAAAAFISLEIKFPADDLSPERFSSAEYSPASEKVLNKQQPSWHFQIDSLKEIILEKPIDDNMAISLRHYYANYRFDTPREKEFAGRMKDLNDRNFILALIDKREGNFLRMYENLKSIQGSLPGYFYYYDELIFSAQASDKMDELKGLPAFKKAPPKIKSYINSLFLASQGGYDRALSEIMEVKKQDSTSVPVLINLAGILRNTGAYDEAYRIAGKAERHSNGNDVILQEICLVRAALLYLSGRYGESKEEYMKSRNLSDRTGSRLNAARAAVGLGILSDTEGMTDSARKHFGLALELARSVNDTEGQAFALSELGVSYTYTNDLLKARENYLGSYRLYKSLGSRMRMSYLANNLGKLFMVQFNYSAALEYYNHGLHYAGSGRRAQVLNLTGIADVYANLSNYSKALEYYNRAGKISSEIKDVDLESDISTGLGTLNYNIHLYGNALKHFNEARNRIASGGNPFSEANVFHKIGLTLYSLDSLASSEKYFLRSIELARSIGDVYSLASSLVDLASLQLALNNTEKARGYIEEARILALEQEMDHISAQAFLVSGLIDEKNGLGEAAKGEFFNAMLAARNLNDREIYTAACAFIASGFDHAGQLKDAEKYYMLAVGITEDISRPLFSNDEVQIAFFSGKEQIYNDFASFYLRQNEFEKALGIVDLSHARNTMNNLENLAVQSIIKDRNLLNQLYDYDWMVHSGLYEGESLRLINSAYSRLKDSLINTEPRLKRYLSRGKFHSIDDIRESLSENEYIITIFPAENETFLFLLDNERLRTYRTSSGRSELVKLLAKVSPYYAGGKMRDAYINQDLFSFNLGVSNEIYRKFLEPAVSQLPSNSRLVIVPPAELSTFPFEALVTDFNRNASPYDYSRHQYLVSRFDLSYAPSASVYAELNSGLGRNGHRLASYSREGLGINNNRGEALLIGDPRVKTASASYSLRRGLLEEAKGLPRNLELLPLRYSREEIDGISSILGEGKILLSDEATESNFKKQSPLSRIIHLSTHSFLLDRQPLIFFSNGGDSENDGFLEAGEIVQLELNTELVVLSSCSSGLGLIDGAEGVIGMTKAFLEAGARSVVVSLWEVNDSYTSKFMRLFYLHLKKGLAKPAALRQAKLDFIRYHSANPFYWSAFILSGNTSKVEISDHSTSPMLIFVISLMLFVFAALIFLYFYNGKKIRFRNRS